MTDLPINSATNENIKAETPKVSKLFQCFTNWFWRIAEDSKDMDTKPFDGIL